MKIDNSFTVASFSSDNAVMDYTQAIDRIGLWESERIIFQRFFSPHSSLLDIGCGAGRTTFGLYRLGYRHLTGMDITPKMVESARLYAKKNAIDIPFLVGDAVQMGFDDHSFGNALFSFNGLMQIPKYENRLKALREIHRVLRPSGVFIFTTHDRLNNADYRDFWIKAEMDWNNGKRDPRIYEFGDIIVREHEAPEREIFIHIPEISEIETLLKESGFSIVESPMRSEVALESDTILDFSTDCRFWVAQK